VDDLLDPLDELRASRARLVASADAERCRIERALHDGAQQQLVALAVNLQLARRLAQSDPSAVEPLLEEIGRDVQQALDDVRQLASSIYPALLADLGLADALRAAASVSPVPTRVEPAKLDRHPAEIEATVYFCCVEALAAAQAGKRATIRLRREPHALVFEVVVEGGGPEPWTEQDLVGIDDRLGAAGGRLTILADDGGGASLSGTIPLPAGR